MMKLYYSSKISCLVYSEKSRNSLDVLSFISSIRRWSDAVRCEHISERSAFFSTWIGKWDSCSIVGTYKGYIHKLLSKRFDLIKGRSSQWLKKGYWRAFSRYPARSTKPLKFRLCSNSDVYVLTIHTLHEIVHQWSSTPLK
jgi:hypothetical protein